MILPDERICFVLAPFQLVFHARPCRHGGRLPEKYQEGHYFDIPITRICTRSSSSRQGPLYETCPVLPKHRAHRLTSQSRQPRLVLSQNVIMKDVPDEELEKLPKDGAAEIDHYIYGTPKRYS